jgi:hypothetical protein
VQGLKHKDINTIGEKYLNSNNSVKPHTIYKITTNTICILRKFLLKK